MNTQKSLTLRNARKGKGLLPPNPSRWEQEHNGLDLRHELSLTPADRLPHLDAFELLPRVFVFPHTALPTPPRFQNHFSGSREGRWSGMCIPCDDDVTLVVYNEAHPVTRVRATLMEEYFHLRLDHRPTKLRVLSNGDGTRDYDGTKEAEAYGSGAAALVPYHGLRAMLEGGNSAAAIADHFLVSGQLVEFRIRVSKLSRFLRG